MKKMGCAQCGGAKKMQKGGKITSKDLKDKDFSSKLYTKDGKIKSQVEINKSNNSMKKMQKGGTPMTAKEKARIQKIRDYAKKKLDQNLIPKTSAPMPKSIQVPSYSKYKKAMGGEATNKLNKPRGYAKSQTGGSNIGSMIFGVPNAGMTGPNRNSVTETMKTGGSFAPNRAVQASCKGGMVRDENGRCVMARKMKEGGSTKSFPDLNKDGKVTKADILKGRGVIKKKGRTIPKAQKGTIVKDSISKKSDLDKMREIDNLGPKYFEEYKKLNKPVSKEKKQMLTAKKGGIIKKK
jgi:hypothetical protein